MINKYTYKDLIWIDLESPTSDEVKKIMDEYKIDPLVGQDLLSPTTKPRIETHPGFVYFVLHIPAIKHSHSAQSQDKKKTSIEQEIDFILSHDFIITTHYDSIDPIHKFSRIFEVNSILDKAAIGTHAGFIFFYMMKRVYAGLDDELEAIDDTLRQIESDIFEGKEKEMVYALSEASRNLLDFRQAISHQGEILNGLQSISAELFGADFVKYIKTLIEEYEKIHDRLRAQKELFDELRETNNSLLTTKQSETMKLFTVMAFITLPVSLVVEIISIQAPSNVVIGIPNIFWIVVAGALGAFLIMMIYFRYKKWL